MNPTLTEWLQANKLAELEPVLTENEVDLETLKILTDADLKELGLAFGPRKRLLNAIAELIGQAARHRAGGDTVMLRATKGDTVMLRATDGETTMFRAPESDTALLRAAAGERRQLTVIFCDLVGATAMSENLDQEELHELIKSYYRTCTDVVLRYEGHVANFLGDGLLIYFGWPVAHEDAAERGVRAALEMVAAVKAMRATTPLAARIGIATGSVVVGEASRDGKLETGLVLGETPNLAARLQALAGPNEVVIALTTQRLLGSAFALTPMGAHPLKGFAKPVQVWRVDEALRTAGRFEAAHAGVALAPLVGREEEAALLRSLWQQASGGEGQVLLLGGPPGIGKSRLTQGLRERITEPHATLNFQCSSYHLNSPLHPFIEQFELAAGFARDDAPEQRLEKMEAALLSGGFELAEAAPLFAALLSLPTDGYVPLPLSPQKLKEKTLEALADRVEAQTRRAPVLMVMEDIHWVDPTSQELLELLLRRIHRLPLLLVLTFRPEVEPPWTGRPGVTTLTLNRLGRAQGAQLVDAVTRGKSLPPEVLDEILARTDGVPLFVEELTRSVLQSGQLREEGGHYVLQGPLAALTIPASLRDLLAARLDCLGQVKEFAQIGACIGREFSYQLLERISMLRADLLTAALDTLVESGLVGRRGLPPEADYTFKHALIQDAAYDSLLKSRRGELHARIAQVLEDDFAERVASAPEWLAHHHTQAGHLEQAIPLWRKAGTQAVKRVALKEAVAHLQKGLTLVEQLPPSAERDRVELTLREPLNAAWTGLRGWAAPQVGENAAAILMLAERQRNAQSLVLALWWVWTSTITQGRIADSRQWVERLLNEGDGARELGLQIFGPATAMVQQFLNGQLVESRAQADRALALWDARRAERWIQLTGFDLRTFVEIYACQLLWIMGYPEQARRLGDASVEHARSTGHVFNLVWALTFSAYVYAYRREPERLLERLNEADRLAREQGLAFIYEVSVPQAKGIAELHNGRPREAITLLRHGIERWTKAGGHVRVPLLKSVLAEAVAMEGDPAAAVGLLDECLGQIEQPSGQECLWLAEVLRRKGWVLMRQGRHDEAEPLLRAAMDCARRQAAKSWELRAATALATLLKDTGQRAAARALLAPVFGWFTEGADTPDLIEARMLLEELSAGG